MTIRDLLASAGLARIDAEVLLAHVLEEDRTWLMAHDADEAPMTVERNFAAFVRRRNAGEPIAYIVGTREFYGRAFTVRPGVLIPRPCTEELVTTTIELLDGKSVEGEHEIDAGIVRVVKMFGECAGLGTIVDVGTGSGCIAVTLACERPNLRCIAIDITREALDVASANAKRLGVGGRVNFLQGNALEPFGTFDEPFLLVTNPPYVKDAALLSPETRDREPRLALMGGGDDGGDVLREIVRQARSHPQCRGIVAECLAEQAGIILHSRAPHPT